MACPPVIWLATLLVRNRTSFTGRLPSLRSPGRQCLQEIGLATENSRFAAALTRYISRRTGIACSDPTSAVGALRTLGLRSTANDVESFFSRLDRQAFSPVKESTLDIQRTAQELVAQMETAFADSKKSLVRRTANRSARASRLRVANGVTRKLSILLFAAVAAMSAGSARADESGSDAVTIAPQPKITLTQSQQETILQEAHQAYTQATQLSATDSAETKDQFSMAAEKYQLLVNSGIHSSQLYLNLGNAYLQSGKLGQAIANYERGRTLDPDNRQLSKNLEFANSLVTGNGARGGQAASDSKLPQKILTQSRSANKLVVNLLGSRTLIWILVASSLLFWGLLTVRACYRFPVWRFAIVPLLVLIISAGSYGLTRFATSEVPDGVIVVNEVNLQAGDGEQFDSVGKLESAQGQRVRILAERGSWFQVRTAAGDEGWIHNQDLEVVRESRGI